MNEKKYLIVLDFLYQKYEIEYEKNMSPQDVIQKVRHYFFPCEKTDEYFSVQNVESIDKFCLYRSDLSGPKGATFVTWNIQPEECDYKKYQFYIFRPLINVYLSIYVVFPNEPKKSHYKAYLNIIFPIKKRIKLLKNFLKDNLQNLTKDKKEFKDNPINGFALSFIEGSKELNDEDFIEKSMNGKEILLIVNSENNISQNFFMPGRFYYIQYDPSSNRFSKETESLDESCGFTLSDTRKKLIRKHQDGKNFLDENVLIAFNSTIQTDQFERLDDLFCDNDFYKFVVIFETSEININPIPETFQFVEKRTYNDFPVPQNGRPNIINFEIAGEPKRPKIQPTNLTPNHPLQLNQTVEMLNETETNNTNNRDIHQNLDEKPEQNREENLKPSIEGNLEPNTEGDVELYIEEEEEVIDDDDDNSTENDEEKLLDMFCFHFLEFSKEKQMLNTKTPRPTYFKNLTKEQKTLLKTFKKYYDIYNQSNH